MTAETSKGTDKDDAIRAEWARFAEIWTDKPMTPRQASALWHVLDGWILDLEDWFDEGCTSPLHQVGPFGHLDRRVMMVVADNKAFAAEARERCRAVRDEIDGGILPFERQGRFFDEVLIATALPDAEELMRERPELLAGLPERPPHQVGDDEDLDEEADAPLGDNEWDYVVSTFDDMAQWDDWEVPVRVGHVLLPAILESRHPFSLDPPIG